MATIIWRWWRRCENRSFVVIMKVHQPLDRWPFQLHSQLQSEALFESQVENRIFVDVLVGVEEIKRYASIVLNIKMLKVWLATKILKQNDKKDDTLLTIVMTYAFDFLIPFRIMLIFTSAHMIMYFFFYFSTKTLVDWLICIVLFFRYAFFMKVLNCILLQSSLKKLCKYVFDCFYLQLESLPVSWEIVMPPTVRSFTTT